MADSPTIRPIDTDDAGEVLTIQRAAFASEALIYGDPDMPPLTQTLEELRAELVENLGCVAVTDHRIVGAVRARRAGELLLIGRLAIARISRARASGPCSSPPSRSGGVRPEPPRRAVHRRPERGQPAPVRARGLPPLRRDRRRRDLLPQVAHRLTVMPDDAKAAAPIGTTAFAEVRLTAWACRR